MPAGFVRNALRRICRSIAGAVATLLLAFPALAQDWPSKPVTAIVPFGAGTSLEIVARPLLEQMGRTLGQAFVVENRPGAGGTTGAAHVARSAPDGHTLLVFSSSFSISHSMYAKLPYDTLKDFIPIVPMGLQPRKQS